jgi:hypothetical protein
MGLIPELAAHLAMGIARLSVASLWDEEALDLVEYAADNDLSWPPAWSNGQALTDHLRDRPTETDAKMTDGQVTAVRPRHTPPRTRRHFDASAPAQRWKPAAS